MMVDLSVIIVSYNVRFFLEQALLSISKALKTVSSEIFVVDNGSGDGSIAMVRSRFPDVHLIANTENMGFARANNQALSMARGKVVCLINPDTLVQEDTFRVCLDYLNGNPDTAAVGCKVLNPDGTLQLACRRSYPTPWVAFTKVTGLSDLFPQSRVFGKYNLTYLNPDEEADVEALSGSFMMVRKEVIDKVGLLDESFFMYGEDLDWCYRIRQSGGHIKYIPYTQIIHYKGQSAKEASFDTLPVFYNAMRLFVKKHFSRGWYTLPQWFLILGIWMRGGVGFAMRLMRNLLLPMIDFGCCAAGLMMAILIRFGNLYRWDSYRIVVLLYSLIWIGSLFALGVYERRIQNTVKMIGGILLGWVLNTSLTFFLPQYAHSRQVVLMAGVINAFFVPGWRQIVRGFTRFGHIPGLAKLGRRMGRPRTLIVGPDNFGMQILDRLHGDKSNRYEVLGFLGLTDDDFLCQTPPGFPVLGLVDDLERIARTHRIDEVIFSSESTSYDRILTTVMRSKDLHVDFKMVPRDLDVIIGRTSIDRLDDIPLVDLDYRIYAAPNRFFKRCVDIGVSVLILPVLFFNIIFIILHPAYRLSRRKVLDGRGGCVTILDTALNGRFDVPRFGRLVRILSVLTGKMSLVGMEVLPCRQTKAALGYKPGMTGLVQVNKRKSLGEKEIEQYRVFYLKNYTPLLDLEIVFRSLFRID